MTASTELRQGDVAPPFALADHDGTVRRLSEFAGRHLVLFFYPKADTPGCTTEAQDFSARLADFEAAGATVIGISADPPLKLARFRTKREISVILLSDEANEVLRAYGVWGKKSMYGKTFEGIVRSTFLVGPDGRIAEVWRNVKVPGHAEAVLNAIRKAA